MSAREASGEESGAPHEVQGLGEFKAFERISRISGPSVAKVAPEEPFASEQGAPSFDPISPGGGTILRPTRPCSPGEQEWSGRTGEISSVGWEEARQVQEQRYESPSPCSPGDSEDSQWSRPFPGEIDSCEEEDEDEVEGEGQGQEQGGAEGQGQVEVEGPREDEGQKQEVRRGGATAETLQARSVIGCGGLRPTWWPVSPDDLDPSLLEAPSASDDPVPLSLAEALRTQENSAYWRRDAFALYLEDCAGKAVNVPTSLLRAVLSAVNSSGR